MTVNFIIAAAFFIATLLFIYGLKRMASPVTAPSGIRVAGWGMVLAVAASFLYAFDVREAAADNLGMNLFLALVALGIGVGWAWRSGKKVAMTGMPQMVALYNGMGGGAAAAIAAVELYSGNAQHYGFAVTVLALLGGLIGAVALSGSIVAWAKLDGRLNKTIRFGAQQLVNGGLLALAVLLSIYVLAVGDGGTPDMAITLFFLVSLVLGILLTTPIGGADMPVVISL